MGETGAASPFLKKGIIMATNTTKTKSNTSARTSAKTQVQMNDNADVQERQIVPKEIDPSEFVTVRNGFQGRLIYISPRTGEKFVWNEFGDDVDMELRELKNAKSRYKKYFEQNWFMFDEDWIIDYLGVSQYYKNALPLEHFDDVFKKTPAEAKKIISKLSKGQKRSLSYRAMDMIASKEIDSLKMIDALEEALGIDLIEK